ncbi:uncharacterized protein TNCV_527271 [Trichonephila clavipes]|nr:uncharacterized protein TNCV_527271 [Trichonephila clavipes]
MAFTFLGTCGVYKGLVANMQPIKKGILNSCRAASPLVRLVKGEERWEASDHPQSVLPLNWGGTEPNRIITCMVLKATDNARCPLALCHDEFREPRSDLCRSGGISNNSSKMHSRCLLFRTVNFPRIGMCVWDYIRTL